MTRMHSIARSRRLIFVALPLVAGGALLYGAAASSPDLPVQLPRAGLCGNALAQSDDGSKPVWPTFGVGCGKEAEFQLAAPEKKFRAKITVNDSCTSKDAPTPSELRIQFPHANGTWPGSWTRLCSVADDASKMCEFDIPAGVSPKLSFVCRGEPDTDGSEETASGCGYMLVEVPAD